jgi:hypothetical protein
MGKIDFEDLQSVHGYGEIRAYNASKLANVLFHLRAGAAPRGHRCYGAVVEPGFVKTNLRVPFPFSLFSFTRGSAVNGARPTVFLAWSPAVEGVSATFFSQKGVATKSSKLSYDGDAAKRLWTLSAELTNLNSA